MKAPPLEPTQAEVRDVAAWLRTKFPWAPRETLFSIAGEAFALAWKTYKPETNVPFGWWWKQVAYWTALKDPEVCELDSATVKLLELMGDVELARQAKGKPPLDDAELAASVNALAAKLGVNVVVTPDDVRDARAAREHQRPGELDEDLVPAQEHQRRALQAAADLDKLMLEEGVPSLQRLATNLHKRADDRKSSLDGTVQALRDRTSAQDLELTLKHLQNTVLQPDEAGYLAVTFAMLRLIMTHEESRKSVRPQAITSFIYDHLDHEEILTWGLKLVRSLRLYELALAPLTPVQRSMVVLRLASMSLSRSSLAFAPPITVRKGSGVIDMAEPSKTAHAVAITIEVLTGPINKLRAVAHAHVQMFERPSEVLANASILRATTHAAVTDDRGSVSFLAKPAQHYYVRVSEEADKPGMEFAVPAWGKQWNITVHLPTPRAADKTEGALALAAHAAKNRDAATTLEARAAELEQQGETEEAALQRKGAAELRAVAELQDEIAGAAHTKASEKQQRRRGTKAEEGNQ